MATSAVVHTAVAAVLADRGLMTALSRFSDRLQSRGVNIALSGIDGSGKSTLSAQLETVLTAAGLPVQRLHLFAWYRNLLVMPSVMLSNRWRLRRVAIFDRTIHDNIAKFFVARPALAALLPLCSWLASRCFPAFDYAFYLHASFETIQDRRPDTGPDVFARLAETYQVIIKHAGHAVVSSDERLLRTVLGYLTTLV